MVQDDVRVSLFCSSCTVCPAPSTLSCLLCPVSHTLGLSIVVCLIRPRLPCLRTISVIYSWSSIVVCLVPHRLVSRTLSCLLSVILHCLASVSSRTVSVLSHRPSCLVFSVSSFLSCPALSRSRLFCVVYPVESVLSRTLLVVISTKYIQFLKSSKPCSRNLASIL